jgi:molybdate transport system regulatory protein
VEPSNLRPSSRLTVHVNLWLEANDKVALSQWRVQLLQAIDENGSIRRAAQHMQITYDLAWHRVEEMEQALGMRLVERQRGGPKGGSAQLTQAGRDFVARFNQLAAAVEARLTVFFDEIFGSTP